jgi:tyrosyl-tRNA synthetase
MNKKTLDEIFSRGIVEFIDPGDIFRKKLTNSPEKVVIKLGIDPTRPDIHLGHAVVLRKMRMMQELGAKVVLIIGDFTGRIGDPTGKSKTRPEIDQVEMEKNVQTFLTQFGKILLTDAKHFVWIRNSDWFVSVTDVIAPEPVSYNFTKDKEKLSIQFPANSIPAKAAVWEQTRMQPKFTGGRVESVTLVNFLSILRKLTHSRLIERDMFQDRLKSGDALYMHEMMYPVLQGLDSLVIYKTFGACDVEMGGTDQLFNNMMGREILEMHNLPPQAVMIADILEGTDGKEKMSKSLDNYVSIIDSPTEMFGKTMRIPDELIARWVELCTDLEASTFTKRLKDGENPRNLKAELAAELVKMYHGVEAAKQATEEFTRLFSAGGSGKPDEIQEIHIEEGSWGIIELLTQAKLVESKSEARRLISQGGIKVNDARVDSIETSFEVGKSELILQVGKRKWAKIVS